MRRDQAATKMRPLPQRETSAAARLRTFAKHNDKNMPAAAPFTESALRRDISYLERTLTVLAGNTNPGARVTYARLLVQLRRRRKQLRALLARDFQNWPRYPDAPLDPGA